MMHLDNQIKFFHMIFKMSFQWKKRESISQTQQFFYIFFFKNYNQTE